MKKNYSTFRFVKTLVAIAAIMLVSAQAFAQSCVGSINVSLDATTCYGTIVAADVSASSGTVEISRNGGATWVAQTGTDQLNSTDIGRAVQYRLVTATGTCWGNVVVEDKAAPTIGTPVNVTINCDNGNATNLFASGPTSTIPATLFFGTVATTGTGIVMPAVADCSQREISFSDVSLLNLTCPNPALFTAATSGLTVPVGATAANTIRIVRRTYSAKDIFGNVSAPSAPQFIYVVRNVTAPVAADVSLTCEAGYPSITSNLPTPAGVCGLSFSFVNDLRVNLCGNTYKVVRTWQVVDQCGTGTMASTITQVITVSDAVRPTLTVTGTSYDLAAVQNLATCTLPVTLRKLQPSNQTSGTVGGAAGATSGTININAWADANVCGMGTFSLNVAGADNCGTITITSSDSRYRVVGGVIAGTVMGNTSFVVTSTDQCGNSVSVTVNVNVIDNLSPTAICDGVTATLNNYKTARITGASFNNRSSDNCGIVRILVAKNTPGTPDAPGAFCEFVDYGCGDINVAGLKVWVRYIDAAGNYTDCCVPVAIVDKATISCVVRNIEPIPCNDLRLVDVGSIFVAPTTFYDGCSTPAVVITNTETAPGCGINTFIRRWVYTITNSLGAQSTTCSQTITTTAVRGFRATRLADQNVTCAGAVSTLKQDQDAIIASLQLFHNGGSGTAFSTCSAPVVDTTESIYRNSDYCRVIVRTFVIKDLCQFNAGINSSITQGNAFTTISGNLVQSISDVNGHYIIFTRTIRIQDNTPPTSVPPVVADVCGGVTACTFGFSATLTGSDACGAFAPSGSSLFYTWRIVNAAGAPVNSGIGTAVSASGLAFGTYTVFYRISDLCGNISPEYSFTATGRDCKAPQILVHDKVLALGGIRGNAATGMGELFYIDIRNNISDFCDGDLTNDNKLVMELVLPGEAATPALPRSTTPRTSLMFTCTTPGLGLRQVRVWMRDNAGNWNFAISTINVQDNDFICTVPPPAVAGTIGTETGSPVKDVVVSANTNGIVSGSATSSTTGTYTVSNLTAGTNYQVRAAKAIDNDRRNGITTLDIALISKHLLALEQLGSAYKIIAADVDKNNDVNATDMLHIRRFILSITPSLAGGSAAWRFIDKSYAFRNATNPLGEDFPEVVTLSSVPAGTSAANFMAVKLGDVNNSFDATTVRGSRALVFNANDMDVVAGNEYTVAINADNFNAAAFQGTFAFEGASVKAVKAGNLNNISDANFGMFNNAVTTSWNGKSEATAEVLDITFVATKSGKLSNMLTVNSSVTMAEGYDAAGNAMNVSLKFNTGKVAGGEFALHANTPNPFATSTTIGFNLPKDGQAKLTVYTASGKVLFVKNDTYKAGVNQVTVNKADLNASGLVYYRLDTQDNSATKKMIIIE